MANTKSLDLELSSSQYAYITDANQTGLDLSSDFTIEGWIKLEQLPSTASNKFIIASKWNDNSVNQRAFSIVILSDDKIYISYSDDGTFNAGSITQIKSTNVFVDSNDVGEWIHFAISVDISEASAIIYKDASSVATTSNSSDATSIFNSNANFAIGARNTDSTAIEFFDGLIDEVRVWNDIRTSQEIADNYQKELTGSESGLVAYYKFNDSALDETSNDNDLTLANSPSYSTDVPFGGNTSNFFLLF